MCKWFNWLFGKEKATSTEDNVEMKKYLIVGLGNMAKNMNIRGIMLGLKY